MLLKLITAIATVIAAVSLAVTEIGQPERSPVGYPAPASQSVGDTPDFPIATASPTPTPFPSATPYPLWLDTPVAHPLLTPAPAGYP